MCALVSQWRESATDVSKGALASEGSRLNLGVDGAFADLVGIQQGLPPLGVSGTLVGIH